MKSHLKFNNLKKGNKIEDKTPVENLKIGGSPKSRPNYIKMNVRKDCNVGKKLFFVMEHEQTITEDISLLGRRPNTCSSSI